MNKQIRAGCWGNLSQVKDVLTGEPWEHLRLLYAVLNIFATRHHLFKHISINADRKLASKPSLTKQFSESANIFASFASYGSLHYFKFKAKRVY